MARPCILRQLLFREGSGNLWELNHLSLLFLGQIRGGLWRGLLDGGTDKREFHFPDLFFLDFLRTVVQMGAQILWWFGMGRADGRKFTGVSFLS